MADNTSLQRFVHEALGRGQSKGAVSKVLAEAGWSKEDIASALREYADVDFPLPVPRPRPSLTARDAFTYLVMFAALYVAAFGLGQLLYGLIDVGFPAPERNEWWSNRVTQSIRWAIAMLAVGGPVFVLMVRANERSVARYPAMRTSPVRRWLTYLTLAVASALLIGDAITLIYRFLSGDFTIRFGLKALTLAGISGGVFLHYLRDLRRDEEEAPS
jgi:hypothetical protein